MRGLMKLCKHLNYIRSLSPGKAVFYYETAEADFVPLPTEIHKLNGMKSSFTEAYDSKQKPKPIEPKDLAYGNPHTIDSCFVPPNVKALFCRFELRVEANSLEPDVCDDQDLKSCLSNLAMSYKDRGGYGELARRYCKNILMGNWLWRNQQTKGTRVEVLTTKGHTYVIGDARALPWNGKWSSECLLALNGLAGEMAEALSDSSLYWFADVTASMKTAFCQEIHPSQKFTENVQKNESSRQLSTVECEDGRLAACLHAEKVGAALHMIDDWWTQSDDCRLRVHEYGADKKSLVAHRTPSTNKDFYSLLTKSEDFIDQLKICTKKDGSDIPSDIHFFISVLIKGGLFQRGKD